MKVEHMKRFKTLFSGPASKSLWKDINKNKGKAWGALYHLGCKLQELEVQKEQLEERVAKLENCLSNKLYIR